MKNLLWQESSYIALSIWYLLAAVLQLGYYYGKKVVDEYIDLRCSVLFSSELNRAKMTPTT